MRKSALVIADLQNDFCPGGALQVREGDKIVPIVNRYIELFMAAGLQVYVTRDWHPTETIHFKEFGGKWPPHCIQSTKGAEFHPDMNVPEDSITITKGDSADKDGYSCFDGHDDMGRSFERVLKENGIDHLYIGGLATDYCVLQTALDALKTGFKVTVLLDAVKGVDADDSERAINEMIDSGAGTSTIDGVEPV